MGDGSCGRKLWKRLDRHGATIRELKVGDIECAKISGLSAYSAIHPVFEFP
jgi:hypothetical protein